MRLLIATGGSSHSEAAIALAAYVLQKQDTDQVPTLLTVTKPVADQTQASQILTQAGRLLRELGVPAVRTKARFGRPAEEIIAEAKEGNYDLVIVGERSVHRFVTRMLGSTATHVIEHAPCPVIVAKGIIRPLQRILVCDSGATDPSVLRRFTTRLAGLLQGEEDITILHVMSQITAGPGVSGTQLRAGAEELIQAGTPEGQLLVRDIATLEQLGIHPYPKVRHGLVVDEILQEAESGDYDLVVIGDYRGEGWGRLLLENLAHQIIVKLDRPVLVVR